MNAAQIIDQHKKFHVDELDRLLDGYSSEKIHVVAILGPQSSGKSTLLNGLFETAFQVMNDVQRRQTTQGVWACRKKGGEILVLDVEGTDGRERGEDQDFERKSALFSLAVAQVLIVNVWENSVGLYHAANMSLLRTVMDVHLQLIDPFRCFKTVLLFVVRDYVGKTPKQNLSNVLVEDLKQIWDSVKKPEAAAAKQLEEGFDIQFAFLPHKILQPDEFDSEVRLLRNRFEDPLCQDYIFSTNQEENCVVARDLPVYADGIWRKIELNKDLDLPTERELLAQYRCDEISNAITTGFSTALQDSRSIIASGQIEGALGSQLTSLVDQAKEQFGQETVRYSQSICRKKLEELIERLKQLSYELISRQLESAVRLALKTFNEFMETRDSNVTFRQSLDDACEKAMKYFKSVLVDTTCLSLGNDLESYQQEFFSSLEQRSEILRSEEANLMALSCRKRAEKFLHSLKHSSFGLDGDVTFWESFWSLLKSCTEKLESDIECIHSDTGISDKRFDKLYSDISRWVTEDFTAILREDFSDQRICDRIMNRFERLFSYDDLQLPRIWSDEAQVDLVYRNSRDLSLSLVEEIEEAYVPSWINSSIIKGAFDREKLVLLEANTVNNIRKSLEKQMERRYVEAKRSTVASQTRIPPWVFILLLVLGWNEIMTILSSPIYFLLFLVFGSAFAAVKIFNLTPQLWMAFSFAAHAIKQHWPDGNKQNSGLSPGSGRLKSD